MSEEQKPVEEKQVEKNPNHYELEMLESVGLDETFNQHMDEFLAELTANPPKSYKDEFDAMMKYFSKEEITLVAVNMHNAVSDLDNQAMVLGNMVEDLNEKLHKSENKSGLYLPGN